MKIPALGSIATDVVGIAGAGSISYGAWFVYRPAGFIVAGLLLLTASILTARAS